MKIALKISIFWLLTATIFFFMGASSIHAADPSAEVVAEASADDQNRPALDPYAFKDLISKFSVSDRLHIDHIRAEEMNQSRMNFGDDLNIRDNSFETLQGWLLD